MIAGVVDRRGQSQASERLARIRSTWGQRHDSAHAAIGRADDAPAQSTIDPTATLDGACRLQGTSASIGLDAATDGLVLARGSLGGRPLYYARFAHGHVACSSLAGLLRALDAPH